MLKQNHRFCFWCLATILLAVVSAVIHSLRAYGGPPQISGALASTQTSVSRPVGVDQLATDYNTLVFLDKSTVYTFSLTDGQLQPIAESVGYLWDVSSKDNMLAFESREGDLYLVNIDGTALRQVTEGEGEISALSWSPNGEKLAYVVAQRELFILHPETLKKERVDLNEAGVPCHSVKWLSDNHHLLYDACIALPTDEPDEPTARFDLSLVDVDTGNVIDLSDKTASVLQFWPSPDGQMVIFSTTRYLKAPEKPDGYMSDFRVFLVSLETREPVEVLDRFLESQEPYYVWYPEPWSPDSNWALLPLRPVLTDTLRAVTPDGTLHCEIIPISCMMRGGPATLCRAYLSPDGKTIAGDGRLTDKGNENLCAVNTDGTNFRVLVPDTLLYELVWSPDGRSIFFIHTSRIGSSDYRYGIVNVDGSGYHDPFADLIKELGYIENVRWLRLSPQTPTPTATFLAANTLTPTVTPLSTEPAIPTPTATPTPLPVPMLPATKPALVLTATPLPTSTDVSISTPASDGGVCTVSGAIVLVAVLTWWALRKRE